jgi:hypothetical protein
MRDHGRWPSCAYVVWLCVHGDESASAPAWGRRHLVARPDEALTYPPPPHHHTRRRGLPAIRLHAELSARFAAFEALRIDGQELSWAPHGEAMPPWRRGSPSAPDRPVDHVTRDDRRRPRQGAVHRLDRGTGH